MTTTKQIAEKIVDHIVGDMAVVAGCAATDRIKAFYRDHWILEVEAVIHRWKYYDEPA